MRAVGMEKSSDPAGVPKKKFRIGSVYLNMKTWNSVKVIGGVAVATLLMGAQAQAIVAYNFPANLPGNQAAGPFSLGTVFDVNSPIAVGKLGAFDPGGAEFAGAGVQVGIYRVTLSGNNLSLGTLVTPVATFVGAQTLLQNSSTVMQDITRTTLGAGTYMVVANNYGVGGSLVNYNPYYDGGPSGPNAASANPAYGVTFTGTAFFNSSGSLASTINGWSYDGTGQYYTGTPEAPRYGAGNFDFTPVPEAATFGVAGVGLLGLVYIGRYVRVRRNLKPA
jgi:hypothetical protein